VSRDRLHNTDEKERERTKIREGVQDGSRFKTHEDGENTQKQMLATSRPKRTQKHTQIYEIFQKQQIQNKRQKKHSAKVSESAKGEHQREAKQSVPPKEPEPKVQEDNNLMQESKTDPEPIPK
jgi:hypothetical protein